MSATTAVPRLSVTTNEAAEALGVAPKTLRNWRNRGAGPRYRRISPTLVLYRVEDLKSFLADAG
ncbi:MAG: helix-turn-helix domain-containing protein [Gordonia sp. (in: high G+C Gram-positive bacteria)]|uniref:helix-turn-helix transcriptional regulator n=1 Tax=Gordonia sp. (in: high G+C Gram-positive bacteria) TaxID=84139 RepID=UPI003C7147FE